MALRINRITFPTRLLISLLILLSGYVMAGTELLRLDRHGGTEWWVYLKWLLILASPVSFYQNLGGMLGAIALLILCFLRLDLLIAFATTGMGLVLGWFGLQDSDPILDNDRPLHWREWLMGIVLLGLGVVFALSILNLADYYHGKPNWGTGIWLALIAYSLTVTGTQLKLAEIPPRMAMITLGLIMGAGVIAGYIYGLFQIPIPIVS